MSNFCQYPFLIKDLLLPSKFLARLRYTFQYHILWLIFNQFQMHTHALSRFLTPTFKYVPISIICQEKIQKIHTNKRI